MSKSTQPMQVMPIIRVESVDAVRDFYVESLGFDHVMGVLGKDGQLDFVTLVRAGARLMFSRPRTESPPAGARGAQHDVALYMQVDDVQAYHDRLKSKGVRLTEGLVDQWWGDRTFKLVDPAGYEVWFYQTVNEPKPPEGMKIV